MQEEFKPTNTTGTTRDGFGIGLSEVAAQDEKIVGLCADLTESTRMNIFKDAYPKRFVQMGVAEENMMGVAAGLALTGKVPFAASYAVFSPGNSLGVIRSSICYSNLNVKLVGGHAGITIGQDGATHQALEDIATMRVLPNMTVVVPCDQEEARKATHALAKHHGPAYLRTGKYNTPDVTTPQTPFEVGTANTLRQGSDIAIIACGHMVAVALEAAKRLAGVHSASVINMHTIKPLDYYTIKKAAQQHRGIITIEEHQRAGGLGSAVAESLADQNIQVPLQIIGIADTFGESGEPEALLQKYGLTAEAIEDAANHMLSQ